MCHETDGLRPHWAVATDVESKVVLQSAWRMRLGGHFACVGFSWLFSL